jgi:hypothetical protein
MSTAVLDKLCTERDEVRAAAIAIAESDDFHPDDKTYVELRGRASDLDQRIGSLADLLDAQHAADNLDGRLAKSAQARQTRADAPAAQTRQSWGDSFVRSDAFTDYRGRGTSARFDLEFEDVESRALPTGIADLIAAGLKPAPYSVDTTPPPAPTPLLSNMTQIQVSGNAIEYVKWAKVAGGAAKVAEKADKPSAEWLPSVASTTLDTIAVWTQLTRQMIEDFPAVRSYIDNELRRDVARAEEAEATAVLAASAAAIPNVPVAPGTTLLAAIRAGVGIVQSAGYNPSAILLNPADWAALDVDVMGETLNGPVIRQAFWGLTVIPSTSQPAGTAIVGDFRSAMHHYYRSAISLYISDSHASTFIANIFTLLSERRSKTAVVRPQALAEATKGA